MTFGQRVLVYFPRSRNTFSNSIVIELTCAIWVWWFGWDGMRKSPTYFVSIVYKSRMDKVFA